MKNLGRMNYSTQKKEGTESLSLSLSAYFRSTGREERAPARSSNRSPLVFFNGRAPRTVWFSSDNSCFITAGGKEGTIEVTLRILSKATSRRNWTSASVLFVRTTPSRNFSFEKKKLPFRMFPTRSCFSFFFFFRWIIVSWIKIGSISLWFYLFGSFWINCTIQNVRSFLLNQDNLEMNAKK